MKVLFFHASLFLVLGSYAQFPGDVSTNLRGWYKGNAGVTLTTGFVSQWSDQTTNGFHAIQTTATRRPAPNTTGFNYNPTISFDGQDNYLNVPDLMATTATGVSAFAVVRQTAANRDDWGCVILGQANGPAWTGGGYGLTALNAGNTSFGFWVRDYNANVVARTTTLPEPCLMSGIWNGTTANNVQYFHDGASQGTDPYTPGSVGDQGGTYIGSGFGSGDEYCFYGDIAELAVYNAGVSAADANKINSYLALKYGITLGTSYVNTTGGTLFANAAPYINDIIGIGRDDNNLLVQKQSHNYDDSVRVYISSLAASNTANTGVFSNNVSYVILGANTGRLVGIRTEKPASVFSRLGREWKVTNTNFPSTFNVDIKLSSSAVLGSISTSDLRLLIDTDGDFSNATVYAAGGGLSFSYANPVITVSGISTSLIPSGTTAYITIASAAGTTPLPIELLSFEAIACKNEVCLNWQTAAEKDNDSFEIQRSGDGNTWETILIIKGAGKSLTRLSYSEIDTAPLTGVSYYRLKQNDHGSGFSYSPVVSIHLNEAARTKFYPVPADQFLVIENPLSLEATLYNAAGAELSTRLHLHTSENGSLLVDTSVLPEGIYILKFNGSFSSASRLKFVVKH